MVLNLIFCVILPEDGVIVQRVGVIVERLGVIVAQRVGVIVEKLSVIEHRLGVIVPQDHRLTKRPKTPHLQRQRLTVSPKKDSPRDRD